jgi:hypothetical protein
MKVDGRSTDVPCPSNARLIDGRPRTTVRRASLTGNPFLNIPPFEDEDEFPDAARAREVRVLESQIVRVASRECPVEEVTALQIEVNRWLNGVTAADAVRASVLSCPHWHLQPGHLLFRIHSPHHCS